MMRNLYTQIVFAVFSLIFSETLYAQNNNILVKGIVSDTSAHPIPGVSVIVSGDSKTGVVTDKNGNYSITVKSNATLIFSSIGFRSERVPVN
ncbi:MAG: TonB-dependent Receptor Plug Domain protein, partial [Daejeonella sp.]|nr:TonB-dependent Receptor Plug Domain protein [Daejeonella sp.]